MKPHQSPIPGEKDAKNKYKTTSYIKFWVKLCKQESSCEIHLNLTSKVFLTMNNLNYNMN